jgi:hypothetical protein
LQVPVVGDVWPIAIVNVAGPPIVDGVAVLELVI